MPLKIPEKNARSFLSMFARKSQMLPEKVSTLYIYICTCTTLYVHRYTCMYMYIYTLMHINMCVQMYASIHI